MTNSELKEKEDKEKINENKNSSDDFSLKEKNDNLQKEESKEEIKEENKKEINEENKEEKKEENKEENKQEKKINEYPNDKIELLDYFLSFVETDSELNYVLTGYFSKFLIMLFLKKPIIIKE